MFKKSFSLIFFGIIFVFLGLVPADFSYAETVQDIETDENKWTNFDDYIVINQDTVWSGKKIFNNPAKSIVIVDGATLKIEAGTQIELLNLYVYSGRIIAEGTREDKIYFRKANADLFMFGEGYDPECFNQESGLIEFSNDNAGESLMRYVEFSNMGTARYVDRKKCSRGMSWLDNWRAFFLPSVYAQDVIMPNLINPAIRIKAGNLRIENSVFRNNAYADIEVNIDNYEGEMRSSLEVVNSNFSGNAQNVALISHAKKYANNNEELGVDFSAVKLKNNWYDSSFGPKTEINNFSGGELLQGDYALDGFRTTDFIIDPVIIIPGIMGSEKNASGELVLDPILHTYDDLLVSLEKNGYKENQTVFTFPYEWRDDNIQSANLLKNKIEQIKKISGLSKVDLVAHSMGGLVARSYIEGANYQDDVNHLILLGVPNVGAPETYLKWEAGEGFFTIEEKIIKHHFEMEALHSGYANLYTYLRKEVPSAQELLPIYDYLFDVAKNSTRKYFENYPRNKFLEDLNQKDNLEKLKKVKLINIIGEGDKKNTIAKIRVVNSTVEGRWENGMPEKFYNNMGDYTIESSLGDETVPLDSAKAIPAEKQTILNSSHINLPQEAQCEVLYELTGKNSCEEVNKTHIPNILLFNVFSPIDIQIISPSGKIVGKDFDKNKAVNQIDGAYYSGYETANEFITIPNPENGKYRILTQGTGTGKYMIEVARISKTNESAPIEFATTFSGTTTTGDKEELAVLVAENGVINPEQQTQTDSNSNENTKSVIEENTETPVASATILPENNPVTLKISNNSNNTNYKKSKTKKTQKEILVATVSKNVKTENFSSNNLAVKGENDFIVPVSQSTDMEKQQAERESEFVFTFSIFGFLLLFEYFFGRIRASKL